MPTTILAEEFRPIADFPGYRISNTGRAQSCWKRRGGYPGRPGFNEMAMSDQWHDLTPRPTKKGYLRVGLTRDGKTHHVLIHKLVLETFGGPRPKGLVCRHLDGDPTNNQIDNLAWGTSQQNWEDRRAHGRARAGSECRTAKLVEADVAEILRLAAQDVPGDEIAARYGVDPTTVYRIIQGRVWRHISRDGIDLSQRPRNRQVKLTPDEVAEMRRLHSEGWDCKRLAERYRISHSSCHDAVRRKTWRHVE